jgi:trigger factor
MTDDNLAVDDAAELGTEEVDDEAKEKEKLKGAVEVKSQDVGTLRRKLTITVDGKYIDERRHDQFDELRRDSQIAGFRKGRAPLRLVEKRFGRDVGDQMLGPLVGSAYMTAVEKEEIDKRTIGEPLIWVKMPEDRKGDDGKKQTVLVDKLVDVEQALDFLHVPEGAEPMVLECEIELRPEFELPELKGIPLEKTKVEITDEMVSSEVQRLREMNGRYMPVDEGGIEPDDMVVAGYTFSVDGREIAAESNKAFAARDQRFENIQVTGLGDALKGKKLNDLVKVQAEVPQDYDNAELRGKKAEFELTVQDIKRLEVPELDDNLLQSYGAESVDDLKQMMREHLEADRERMANERLRSGVRDYLLEKVEFELPSGLSQRQTDRAVARMVLQMYRMGIPQQEVEKRMDDLKTSASQDAVNDLRFFFIMDKIAGELELDVSEEELNSAIASIAARRGRRFDRVRDELGREGGLETLYLQIRDEKIMDRLIADGEITESAEESPKTKKDKSASSKKKG